jgi:hypothetical protein
MSAKQKKITKLFTDLQNDKVYKDLGKSKKELKECILNKCTIKIPFTNIPLPIPKVGCKETKCQKELTNIKQNSIKLVKSKKFNKLVNASSKTENNTKIFLNVYSKKFLNVLAKKL